MIYIGLAGWGDHDDLYQGSTKSNEKLIIYSGHFPVVEIDSSFYGIQPKKNYEKWVKDTPDDFRFVVKAFQGITGHSRGELPFKSRDVMYELFIESLEPLITSNKLAMVLCQFPPWFHCSKENVQALRYCKRKFGEIPVSLEFRHQSWFSLQYRQKTLQFMRDEGWIHSICDEPQAGVGSIPVVLENTDSKKTLIRFHGRNTKGWNDPGDGNWRDVRYLYTYSKEELLEWKENILQLKESTEELYIIFNNNSGGDAAQNGKDLIDLLNIEYTGLAPRQLGLFE
ncbi:DUF72 domain-containing protein [Bacillus sp. FJAT-45350]|uniref:DUF72 domain-containing protein n=1 Tax=Bacillus sp. FJAT-45350 TaxID=2011014 RepID=UPI000BB8456B|nr:DUF72 domain-containing protein [Bacillus sp. FJAT-45350]